MSTKWQIQVLGGLRAERGGRVVTRFQTRKAGALLGYLAFFADRPHPRETLIEMLWPECDPRSGRNNLSVTLSSLRHQLEPPGEAAGSVILADRLNARLNPEVIATDSGAFERRVRECRLAPEEARPNLLAAAAEAYAGELLPGYYEDWIEPERRRLTELYLQVLYEATDLALRAGEPHRAADLAHRAIRAEPTRERSHRELMRALHAAGRPEAAVDQFEELRRLLARDLDLAPSAETQALARSIGGAISRGGSVSAEPPPSPRLKPPDRLEPADRETAAPTGTVTFLLAELLDSPTGEGARTLRKEIRTHGGWTAADDGIRFSAAFARASEALACAVACLRRLPAPAAVRLALHTGEVEFRAGAYSGPILPYAEQLRDQASPGQILCSEACAGLVRTGLLSVLEPGLRLFDLDPRRNGELQEARLFEVLLPGQASKGRADRLAPCNLPLSINRFFGRGRELDWLREALRAGSGEGRLVTLTGAGGTGKTRLSIEAVTPLMEDYRGALWFASLADLHDHRRLPEALLDAVGLRDGSTAEPMKRLSDRLRAQPSLLVLDNFEQLCGSGSRVIADLMKRAEGLKCLATSRRPLGIPGERVLPLSPLAVPDASEDLQWLGRCDSVALFVDRAQAVRPDFQLTARNAAAIADLCLRLEGIPLAIELAASRSQALTPSRMLRLLEDGRGFLTTRRRSVAARHRTLEAAIEWSYQLLPEGLQQLFCALSVFAGGWSLEAAEAVVRPLLPEPTGQPGDLLDSLAQLRECSLVRDAEPSAEPRFTMLEMLREYGAARLSAECADSLRRRHAEYLAALAEAVNRDGPGPRQADWLDRLETEHDNLRRALAWATARAPALGVRLAVALGPFWHLGGHWSEGRRALEAAGAAAADGTPERAAALRWAGKLACRQCEKESGLALLRESLEHSRACGDQRGAAQAMLFLANHGDPERDRLAEEGLALYQAAGDRAGIAEGLMVSGNGYLARCDYDGAARRYAEALELYHTLGDPAGEAQALNNLGAVALEQGTLDTARGHFTASLALRSAGDRQGTAMTLCNLGEALRGLGNAEEASELLLEALGHYREMADTGGVNLCLHALGTAALARGDRSAAARFFREEAELGRTEGSGWMVGMALEGLAEMAEPAAVVCALSARRRLQTEEGHREIPSARADTDATLAECRRDLGDRRFEAAWRRGQSLNRDQAAVWAAATLAELAG